MSDKHSGGCLCGVIRFEAEGPPSEVYTCSCSMCQRHTGSAFWVGAKFAHESFRYIQGEPKLYDSSHLITRSFCPDCGSTLALVYSDPPWDDFVPGIEVAVGTLDQPERVAPTDHYGIESKQAWLQFDPAAKQHRWDEDPVLQAALAKGPKDAAG